MIDFYFWTTPNGYKVLMYLEETGIPYRMVPVNISEAEQFDPAFLNISPNNKIPAIVDHDPVQGNRPVSVFESGAILLYLAEKTGLLIPDNLNERFDVLQWLFWQMSGLGPMAGQSMHFVHYAPEVLFYAIDRYVKETSRLFKVLDTQLTGRDYITDRYSIADIASYPWIAAFEKLNQDLKDFPSLQAWYERIANRPATISAYEKGKGINITPAVTEKSRKILLGQSAQSLAI